ncbi:MAG: hypothetical protein KKB02_06085 [Alphaproteobacteria bacterium]|nr:hypothetical protein [Alphaproteobacteria bacterium]
MGHVILGNVVRSTDIQGHGRLCQTCRDILRLIIARLGAGSFRKGEAFFGVDHETLRERICVSLLIQ